jgi:prepilin-type N-terminal cleavage/methylation domain-containing protein
MTRRTPEDGFTLVELLIVIAIVAVLAVVVILTLNPAAMLDSAKTKTTQSQINRLANTISEIKGITGKTSLQITGQGCSDCNCRTGVIDQNASTCITTWKNSLNAFSNEAKLTGVYSGLSDFYSDAWGTPFLLDENEGESGGCLHDSLRSAGADKRYGTSDDIYPYDSVTYIRNVSQACMSQ